MDGGAWKAAVHGVTEGQTQLSDFTFTFHFHALEKKMATHSSVLAWRIPGTGEPGGLPSMGLHRVGHDWSDLAAAAVDLRQNLCLRENGHKDTVKRGRGQMKGLYSRAWAWSLMFQNQKLSINHRFRVGRYISGKTGDYQERIGMRKGTRRIEKDRGAIIKCNFINLIY